MRLLLDEMYPPAIAQQLRSVGHEVGAITERPELRGLPDALVFDAAQQERRVLVTENVADFSILADERDARALPHHGIVFVHPRTFPRGRPQTLGKLVRRLARLLDEHPSEAAASLRLWL